MVRSSATPGPVYDIPETLGTTVSHDTCVSLLRFSVGSSILLSTRKRPTSGETLSGETPRPWIL